MARGIARRYRKEQQRGNAYFARVRAKMEGEPTEIVKLGLKSYNPVVRSAASTVIGCRQIRKYLENGGGSRS